MYNDVKYLGWGKFSAIILIIMGVLSLPLGIISIMAGAKLWTTVNKLENLKEVWDEAELRESIKSLSEFFLWFGLNYFIGITALIVILVILLLAFGTLITVGALHTT